jgi:hypothetical protein
LLPQTSKQFHRHGDGPVPGFRVRDGDSHGPFVGSDWFG